ncbi:DMT family transporter [Cetobacterium sp. 8H]|uniref:DMT family transporter n=1 Tax=Cetobacterium sp. 8H TaxID=2759681 RepID=UPI00163CA087|nr:DMT family transporter [Cetobacterium sp. 8H]MBC2850931.1 DMT family transporter [Cetobacterium sp. 8H]
MKFETISDIKKGIVCGGLSGLTWGADTVFLGLLLSMSPFIDTEFFLLIGFIIGAFFHDMSSSIFMIAYMKKKNILKKAIKTIFTKPGIIIVLASIMGGPVGMTGYLMGIKYSGPAYTATFSAIYPAIGAFFAHFLLKEQLSKRAWVGILVGVMGVVGLGYTPINIVDYPDFKIGIFYILLCIIGWSLETVIIAYGMKYGDIEPEVAMFIRQTISFLVYGILIVPLISGQQLVIEIFKSKMIFLIAVVAISGTISYLLWYRSIEMIGAARATVLNITYMVWAIILQVIVFGTKISLNFILFSTLIILGVILVIGNPKEMLKIKNNNLKEAGEC